MCITPYYASLIKQENYRRDPIFRQSFPDPAELTISKCDMKDVYRPLVANQPYVGLNSCYSYFLLAKDLSDTYVVVEQYNKVVTFSSGYVPLDRPDIFFNWEALVDKDYRGHGLQKRMLLFQIKVTDAKYFGAL